MMKRFAPRRRNNIRRRLRLPASGIGFLWAGSRRRGTALPAADRGEAGFTLLELLVVIVILGLLIGLVAPAALRQLGGAKVSIARQSIQRLSSVLDLYKLDTGNYPSSEQGLEALVRQPEDAPNWNGPYLKGNQLPLDPWNHPYLYHNPSTRDGYDYDLCSEGPNGKPGGTDTGSMICNS